MFLIRPYQAKDSEKLNTLAVSAFEQFQHQYPEWQRFKTAISKMSELNTSGQIWVAEISDQLVGAVALIPPAKHHSPHFEEDWAVIRMLVVSPDFRNQGIGKALLSHCLSEAKHASFSTIGIHTSPIMDAALTLYLKSGFQKVKVVPALFGVHYSVYKLTL